MSYLQQFHMDGKVALITGSTRGIGRAIAEGFAEAGAKVVINGRSADGVSRVVAELRREGGDAAGAPGDITNPEQVERVFSATLEAYRRIDVLVNNASISTVYKRAEDVTPDEWHQHLSSNLTAAFLCSRLAGRYMKDHGGGVIVNLSSIGGQVALTRLLAYCVAKGGLDQMTRVMAAEWAPYGIRVNAIAPAFVETDMTRGLLHHARYAPELLAKTPLGRFGTPLEVVGAAIYLASDASSYVTGHVLAVDGGWAAW